MRKLLDTLFSNKKASLVIPPCIALVLYALFLLFNNNLDKSDDILATPIISVIWFVGVFLVLFVQVKNKNCHEWFLNVVLFLAITVFTLLAIFDIVRFFISGFKEFPPFMCAEIITWSSISLAHNKRRI